jgi:hypothetical protein
MAGKVVVKDSRKMGEPGVGVSLKDVNDVTDLKDAIAPKLGRDVVQSDFQLVVPKAKESGGMETPEEALKAAMENNERWITDLLAPLKTVGIEAGSKIVAHFAGGAFELAGVGCGASIARVCCACSPILTPRSLRHPITLSFFPPQARRAPLSRLSRAARALSQAALSARLPRVRPKRHSRLRALGLARGEGAFSVEGSGGSRVGIKTWA